MKFRQVKLSKITQPIRPTLKSREEIFNSRELIFYKLPIKDKKMRI